jgi:exocyst complex component 6
VLNTTGNFRSEREVEELWDALLTRLTTVVENALKKEMEADSFLRVKESLMGFVMTLEVSIFVFFFPMISHPF